MNRKEDIDKALEELREYVNDDDYHFNRSVQDQLNVKLDELKREIMSYYGDDL